MYLVFLGLFLVITLCFLDWLLQNKNNFKSPRDKTLAEEKEYIKEMALEMAYKNKSFLKKNLKDRKIWIEAVEKRLMEALKRSKEDVGIKPFCYSLSLMEIADSYHTGNKIRPFYRNSFWYSTLIKQFISRILNMFSFGIKILTDPKKIVDGILLLFSLGYFAICFIPILFAGFFYNIFLGIIWFIVSSFIFIMIGFAIHNKNS